MAIPLLPNPLPPRYAGILSAVGIHLADVVAEVQEPAAATLGPDGPGPELLERQARLEQQAVDKLLQQVGGWAGSVWVKTHVRRCGGS